MKNVLKSMKSVAFAALVMGLALGARAAEPVASITTGAGTTNYDSVQAAINAATAGQTVKLLVDRQENISVAEGDNLTLDLNGHVLNGDGTSSVIYVAPSGTLTVTDSDKSKVHYFKVITDPAQSTLESKKTDYACLWVLDGEATGGTPLEELTDIPTNGAYVAIRGGVITGGRGSKRQIVGGGEGYFGGGIISCGFLTLDNATVCGNTFGQNEGTLPCYGAGVYVEKGGSCILTNGAVVCGNSYCGASGYGGGIYSSAPVTIAEGCSVSYNSAYFSGGLRIVDVDMSATGCSIRRNVANSVGGLYFACDAHNEPSTLTMNNCIVDGNLSYGSAGGIHSVHGNVTFSGGRITDNRAVDLGGGIVIENGNGTETATIIGATISGNRSGKNGGGVYFASGTNSLTDVVIADNIAAGDGGGVYSSSTLVANNVPLTNNQASAENASVGSCAGGAIYVGAGSLSALANCLISGNAAIGNGGGVFIASILDTVENSKIGKAELTNVEVRDNTAGNGGGIGLAGASQLFAKGCLVKGNSATAAGGGIYKLGGNQQNVDYAWDKVVLVDTAIVGNAAGSDGGGIDFSKYVHYEVTGCLVAGTLVSMADGTQKPVEEVVAGDVVKTFDHEGGTNSTARVYYAFKSEGKSVPFTLEFDTPLSTSTSNLNLSIVGCHDLLEQGSLKYVTITGANVGQYIGAKFYGEDGAWHTLTNVTMGTEPVEYYSLYSAQHQNVYANGLLTVADDVDYLLNIYELDENLKADAEQLAADLEQYGAFSYEEAATYGVSRAWYEDGCVKLLNVAIGKQLVSREYAEKLFASTGRGGVLASPVVRQDAAPTLFAAPKLMGAAPMMATAGDSPSANDPTLEGAQTGCLTLGRNVVVTNNIANSAVNNISLHTVLKSENDKTKAKTYENSLIALAESHAGICAGVTLEWGSGQFTTTDNVTASDTALFASDNATYAVHFDNAGYLKLSNENVTFTATEVAHTTYKVFANGVDVTSGASYSFSPNSPAVIAYTAESGYCFADGSTVVSNEINTACNPTTVVVPAEPFCPVARSVKTDGGSSVTKYHPSLAAAVDAIGMGGTGTVTMLADVTMAGTGAAWVPDGSDLTLDLAGKRIDWTTSKGDSILYFEAGTAGKLTIMDSGVGGMISTYCDSSEVTNSALIAYCAGYGDLTVNGGTFVCSNKVGAATLFFKNGTGDWTFNSGTYKALGEGAGGAHFLYCAAATGTTRITGGTYDIRAAASAAAGIASNDECHDKIAITGGDFDVVTAGAWGGAFSCRNGSLVIDGGDFNVMSSVPGVYCVLAERGGTTILSNGTFRAETTDGYAYAVGAAETATLTIAGGTYSSKAFKDTAATVIGKEQSKVTLVGNPTINNGATGGNAWNLAVQLYGAHLDFSGYTGAKLPALAVFADGTYGASYVTGPMTNFDSQATWIWAGYFSTRPYDSSVQDGKLPLVNCDYATGVDYPWVIGTAVCTMTIDGVMEYYGDMQDAWDAATDVGTAADPATVKMLVNVALSGTLETSEGADVTLDLNDKVLSAADGFGNSLIVCKSGSRFAIVDTSTTKTTKYFDASGDLWVWTNEVTACSVSGGVVTGANADYGAVDCHASDLTVSDVAFVGNHGATRGAAVYLDAPNANILGCTFLGNVADCFGGAICCEQEAQLLVKDCQIRFNVAGQMGGAIYMSGWRTDDYPEDKCVLLRTAITDNKAGSGGGGVYFRKGYYFSCFVAGTLVRMADGSEKRIEEVAEGDVVRTFDHEGGTNSSARVFICVKDKLAAQSFRLDFADGKSVCCVLTHDFLEKSSRKYVDISRANAAEFIGKSFYGEDGEWHELVRVTDEEVVNEYYEIYTARHLNSYANGMLTLPSDVACLLNIYELDESLKADAAKLAADIAEYGVTSYAEAATYGMSREWYDDALAKYVNISVGKGLTTFREQRRLFAETQEIADPKIVAVPKMATAPKLTAGSANADPTIAMAKVGVLTLGENVVVTNNTVDTASNNLYLYGSGSFVDLADGHDGIAAGMTLSGNVGQFTTSNNVSSFEVSLFTSDDPEIVVRYDEGGNYLKLGYTGIQVGDDAWAKVADGVCTVRGTGDMWNKENWPSSTNPLAAYKEAITNVVISNGVTSVGSQFFQGFWSLQDVSLDASVTNIGTRAFKKCFCLTNVTSEATGSVALSDYAFVSCNSLEKMTFAGNPTFGTQSYTLMAGIYMKDGGIPVVYTIPEITTGGLSRHLMGKKSLADEGWDDVTSLTDEQRKEYHFFKVEMK